MSDPNNLWRSTAQNADPEPPLDQKLSCDVAIIGGGFTGLSAALHLAQAGANTCLLEAETIGHGGSGRNVGLVNAGLWKSPEQVIETLGKPVGERLTNHLAEAPSLVFNLIEHHQITCEATRHGTLHCAHSAAGWRDLQDRYRQQVAREAPVKLLSAAQVAERTGSTQFYGALWDGRAGTIQPLSFAIGLARAARAAGAMLFEHSPAQAVHFTDNLWHVQTTTGQIAAQHLIQATNAYGSHGLSQNSYVPVHYFQVATDPIPAALRYDILPGGEGCWDTARVMSSFRLDQSGRMVIGAIGNLDAAGSQIHRNWARRKLYALYPQLAGLGFRHSWCGRIAITDTYLPRVANIGLRAISIYGYSGRGIGPGVLFGKCAADWVVNDNENAFPVAITSDRPTLRHRAKAFLIETGACLSHLTDSWFPHGNIPR